MTAKMDDRKRSIARLLNSATDKSIRIAGDPDGLWFMLEHVRLGRERHKLRTCVMVKFLDANKLVILVPDNIDTHCGMDTCQRFFQKCTFIKGWRAICPYIISEVGNDLLELTQRIAGLIVNPHLCGFVGCEKRLAIGPALNNKPFVPSAKDTGNDDIPY
jgi:hypothetical protein